MAARIFIRKIVIYQHWKDRRLLSSDMVVRDMLML